jgi:hypothetical protein
MKKVDMTPFWIARLALLVLTGLVYGLSISPSVSFWDCGEFIAASHVLGIPHPPGSPLFVILGRFWELAFAWIGPVALRINMLSAVASILGAWLACEISLEVTRAWMLSDRLKATLGFMAGTLVAFSDTWWFNAVEAETYGVSMAMTLLTVWLVLRWDREPVESRGKWVLLFVYVAFLGMGVHTNSMIAFPLGWLYMGIRSGHLFPRFWLWLMLGLGLGVFGLLLLDPTRYGDWVLLSAVAFSGSALMFMSLRTREIKDLPFWILGLFLFTAVFITEYFLKGLALAILLLGLGYVFLRIRGIQSPADRSVLSVGMALALLLSAGVGYSVQLVMPIRSTTNPIMDENNPETWEDVRDALERKQYGSMGMFERAIWRRGQLQSQFGFGDRIGYLGYHLNQFMPAPLGAQVALAPSEAFAKGIPGIFQMLHRFFWELMLVVVIGVGILLRRDPRAAFLWGLFLLTSLGLIFYVNFSDGTRADSREASNWHQRIRTLEREVPKGELPPMESLEEMRSTIEDWRLTGIESPKMQNLMAWEKAAVALGTHIPMPPRSVHREVRERDYFFTPPFALYGILLALSLGALALRARRSWTTRAIMVLACSAWAIPVLTHFETHDRSGDWVPQEFAWNMLQSVPQGGVLVTFGDNDTFPLWYLQMVEGVRTDVLVVNSSLAQMKWYQDQMKIQRPDLNFSHSTQEYADRAGQLQYSRTLNVNGVAGFFAGDSAWRPYPADQFLMELVTENWPRVPVCFTFNVGAGELPGGSALGERWSPVTGLVRQLGATETQADSLLYARMNSGYRMEGFKNGKWRYQESTARAAQNYRYLFNLTHSRMPLADASKMDIREQLVKN